MWSFPDLVCKTSKQHITNTDNNYIMNTATINSSPSIINSTTTTTKGINIFQSIDIKLRNSNKNDRSRIQRTIVAQNTDIAILKNNYSKRLYDIFHFHWKNKLINRINNVDIDTSSLNFTDSTLSTYLLNRFIALARQVEYNHNTQKKLSQQLSTRPVIKLRFSNGSVCEFTSDELLEQDMP